MNRADIEYWWNEFVYCQDYEAADICQAALDGDADALRWITAEHESVENEP